MTSSLFLGYSLQGVRSALANHASSGTAVSGIIRDFKPIPNNYDTRAQTPPVIDARGDQYFSRVLSQVNGLEYLIIAANNAKIALREDASWLKIDPSAVSIPEGSLSVTNIGGDPFEDGTSRLVIQDPENNSIANVISLQVTRGDNQALVVVSFTFDLVSQVLTMDAPTLAALGGGVSTLRGDTITSCSYYLSASRFWWTRNDRYQKRFQWNSRSQRWTPIPGGSPKSFGQLGVSSSFTLDPKPGGLEVGDILEGDSSIESYAMIRVGKTPNSSSYPVIERTLPDPFSGILVVSDQTSSYDFSADNPPYAAVIGKTNGTLLWNPDFVSTYNGQLVWYSPTKFVETADGLVGSLQETELFLSPIPQFQELPLLRIGSRQYLTVKIVDTEVDLIGLSLSSGEIGLALSTGKVAFSSTDLNKSNPLHANFDLQYANASLYYDGVVCNQIPQPLRDSVPVVDSGGNPVLVGLTNDLFVPDAQALPGLGTSGISHTLDQTGTIPTSGTPSVRPGGDNDGDTTTGLVRTLSSTGESLFFSKTTFLPNVQIKDRKSDLPTNTWEIEQGTVYLAKEKVAGDPGSFLVLSEEDRSLLQGEYLYFLQAELCPSIYTTKARLISLNKGPFTLSGTEKLFIGVNGNTYTWNASSLGAGTHTASTVASSIDAILGVGSAFSKRGFLWIEADNVDTDTIEVGFGSGQVKDLSGCSLLGFLPGWWAQGGIDNWLSDSGVSFGLYRSSSDTEGDQNLPDFRSKGRFVDQVILEDTPEFQSFVFLDYNPLVDIAGYDHNVFFQKVSLVQQGTTTSLVTESLQNFQEIQHLFHEGKFGWLGISPDRTDLVVQATQALPLGQANVIPETLYPQAGGYLKVSENGGTLQTLTLGEDYLLPNNGQDGIAYLITKIGSKKLEGGQGVITANNNSFVDYSANFITTNPGDWLYLPTGVNKGWYKIQSLVDATEIDVKVLFENSEIPVLWEIYEGWEDSVYDPSLLADQQYQRYNPFSETWEIRVLTPLGTTPTSVTNQIANRLQGQIQQSLERGRTLQIRFGTSGENRSLTPLSIVNMGAIENITTFPSSSLLKVASSDFQLQSGSQSFTQGVDLFLVANFTVPVDPDQIEYKSTGEVSFGSNILSSFAGSSFWFLESFSDASGLDQGVVELDTLTGELNINAEDLSDQQGKVVLLVETMIAKDQVDVVINPPTGSFSLREPLKEGMLLETTYPIADETGSAVYDTEGTQTTKTEFLPFSSTLEEAVRQSDTIFSFNPSNRILNEEFVPVLYLDHKEQNFGVSEAYWDFDENQIIFPKGVPSSSKVFITYQTLEANKWEQTFSVSSPVYRPSFYLPPSQDTFSVEGDQRSDLSPGKLFRVGDLTHYIQSVVYDASTNQTTTTIYPSPSDAVGTLAPGEDVLLLLSAKPITDLVKTTVISGARTGFWVTVGASYETLAAKQRVIRIQGDLTQFAVAGHLIEYGGIPFLIVQGQLSEDKKYTEILLGSSHSETLSNTLTLKISVRPIYPENSTVFLGVSPITTDGVSPKSSILLSEDYRLIRDPGDGSPSFELFPNVDYTIDPGTGNISFLPHISGLSKEESLYLHYTKPKTLTPYYQHGSLVFPKITTSFRYLTIATPENGLSGNILRATYTYRNPDSFFCRIVSLQTLSVEIATEISTSIQGGTGHLQSLSSSPKNHERGILSLRNQRLSLLERDRIARTFLSFYHKMVQTFEQVSEAISGNVIGDKDGSFQFSFQKGDLYLSPGSEDPFTGEIVPRNLMSLVFQAVTTNTWTIIETDPIVAPLSATLSSGSVAGDMIENSELDRLMRMQRDFSINEIDDRVLVGLLEAELKYVFPWFRFEALGEYKNLGDSHFLSRLFPESALAFFTTYPGIGATTNDPGVYANSRTIANPAYKTNRGSESSIQVSTNNKTIAKIENPVWGQFTNIASAFITQRHPRARIFSFSPDGYATLAAQTSGRPTIIATPLLLSDFPIDSSGLPDTTQFISQGGTLWDLTSGDPDLKIPPFDGFSSKTEIAFGRPTGELFSIGYGGSNFSIFGLPRIPSVYVDTIYLGCLITLKTIDSFGNDVPITDPSLLVQLSEQTGSFSLFTSSYGDTIYSVPSTGTAEEPSDPPTREDLERLASSLPNYRVGFDLGLDNKKGEIFDLSMPSFTDPSWFGLKELLGQNPPTPLQMLEAQIQFSNGRTQPLKIPALLGEDKNDDGDYSIPYLLAGDTERDVLSRIPDSLRLLLTTKSQDNTQYVYPDEFVIEDGSILGAESGGLPPAMLITSRDVLPVTNGSTEEGIADLQPYDLLFVEVEDSETRITRGAQGVLSVGKCVYNGGLSKSLIRVPRWVSPSRQGDRIRYVFNNVMVHLSGGVSGIIISDNGTDLIFDANTVPSLFFNDGLPGIAGGLNNIVNHPSLVYPNNNKIVFEFFDGPGNLIETVEIKGTAITGGDGPGVLTGVPTFDDHIITFPGGSGVSGLLDPLDPAVGPFSFSISIDTTNGGTNDNTCGSFTGVVNTDRVSFSESFDLSSVLERNSQTGTGHIVQGELEIHTISGPGTNVLSINHPSVVNGGSPFTFLTWGGVIGNFSAASISGANDEEGTVEVASFEAPGNIPVLPVPGKTLRASAIPSSNKDESLPGTGGLILQASATCSPASGNNYRFLSVTPTEGSLAKVNPGDLVSVHSASGGSEIGSVNIGTYLVRHAVKANVLSGSTEEYLEVSLSTYAGNVTGWIKVQFPTLVSFSDTTNQLVVSNILALPAPANQSFPSSGRVYVIVNGNDLQSTTPSVYNNAVISAAYTGITSNTFTGLNDYRDAGNNVLTASEFGSLISVGNLISGMTQFQLSVQGDPLPENNVVGVHDANAIYGFRHITFQNLSISASAKLHFDQSGGDIDTVSGVDQLGVTPFNVTASTSFVNDTLSPIYDNIPGFLDISGISDVSWQLLHHPTNQPSLVRCLIPGDQLLTESNGGTPGFRAKAGIFLEPSFPRTFTDLGSVIARVVDQNHSLGASELGFRDGSSFGGTTQETVLLEVRRMRRFQETLNTVGSEFGKLRYLYAIRRGIVDGWVSGVQGVDTITANSGTTIGPFNDPLVNIREGGKFRILDSSGNVTQEVMICGVINGTQIKVQPPIKEDPTGKSFEIYLTRFPIPHEQSFEELLDLIIDQEVFSTQANYATQVGGYVPSNWADRNKLYDDAITGVGANTFAAKGVLVNDYLLVDPAGLVSGPSGTPSTPEKGNRPVGDRSIPTRPSAHVASKPHALDDNRGFYKVLAVNDDHLVVSPENVLASSVSPYKVFPRNTSLQATLGYTIYPTVSGSTLSGDTTEGQMDLRPTSKAGENGSPVNSFSGNDFSIRPFSYRILRPSSLVSEEVVEFILSERERMLSWLEQLGSLIEGSKSGNYFIFQRDSHIEDLGSITDATFGKGVLLNAHLTDLFGEETIAPFTNSQDCLSILDRRFWIFDQRLDRETPPGGGSFFTDFSSANGSSVRPLLPDYLRRYLDQKDKFRSLRYSWLSFRTEKIEGTLSQIERFDQELERIQEKSENSAKQLKSLGKI